MPEPSSRREFVLVGLVILASVTPLVQGTGKLAAFALILVVLATKSDLPRNAKVGPLLLTFFGVLFGVTQDIFTVGDGAVKALGTHLLFITGLTAGWFLARRVPLTRMIPLLADWATLFAATSLVGVFIYTSFSGVVSSLPAYTYHGFSHHTIGITNLLVGADGVIQRNAGIASEPGLFQVVLNLGVAATLHQRGSQPPFPTLVRLGVLGFAILETRSTAGLAILACLLVIASFRSRRVLLGLAVSVVLAGEVIRTEMRYQAQYKLLGSAAFESRAMPAQQILQQVFQNPFGIGNQAYNAYFEEMRWGSFDSLTQVLIRYGLPLACVLFVLLARNIVRHPMITIVVTGTLLGQPVWHAPLIAYFYYYQSKANKAVQDRKQPQRRLGSVRR